MGTWYEGSSVARRQGANHRVCTGKALYNYREAV